MPILSKLLAPACVGVVLMVAAGCGGGDGVKSTQPASGDLVGVASGAVGTQAAEARSPASATVAPAATAAPRAAATTPSPSPRATTPVPSATPAASSAPAATARSATAIVRSAPNDACRLVTREDVEATLGYSLGAGRLAPNPGRLSSGNCTYLDEPARRGLEVAAILGESTQEKDTRAHWTNLRTTASLRGSQPVQGLGDEAYFVPDLRLLQVLRGDLVLGLQLADPALSPDATRARLMALARAALGRL